MSNPNFLTKKRCVDIVFCIDGTGSMSPCFDNVKTNARRFYADFASTMTDMGSEIDMMRIKIITFRDYKSDGAAAMVQSRFFELPDEEADFSAYLDTQKASGGCNEDANGLEALCYAMRSDFVTGGNDRQVIVLFADTDSIKLKARAGLQNYPADMVDDDGLLELWMCMQSQPSKLRERCKRMVLFAPENTVYEKMKQRFNRSVFKPVQIHRGLNDVSFDDIIKIIAASASSAS